MRQEITSLIATVLQLPYLPTSELSMTTCEAWTSLKHIELIMTIEEKYDVQFSPTDIAKLTSQETLFAKLAELLNTKEYN